LQSNYEGSAGGMEAAAAEIMWLRSGEQSNMRYKTMVADGDTGTHARLRELNEEGKLYPVDKEECINHVAKRMTNGLRAVLDECKAKGIKLGGKGEGQLTEGVIGTLTSYYRYG